MAKSFEQENIRATEWEEQSFKEECSEDDAAFLRSLDQKQAMALQLSEELAVWFGDCGHPIRVSLSERC